MFQVLSDVCFFYIIQANWEIPENKPPRNWPSKGQMSFKQYSTRYREGLDLVLSDIECNIRSGEKVRLISSNKSVMGRYTFLVQNLFLVSIHCSRFLI